MVPQLHSEIEVLRDKTMCWPYLGTVAVSGIQDGRKINGESGKPAW
jgi:hypothetical protein